MTAAATTLKTQEAGRRAKLNWMVHVLFLLSGATGLTLEVAWSRMLGSFLGATTWGVIAVLVGFMAGLGLGAIVWGVAASRSKTPLALYGALEIATGLYALAAPAIFGWLEAGYIRLLHGSTHLPDWSRVIAAAVAMTPATFLMGGTLPALARAIGEGGPAPARTVARLYALNTAGAVLGCLLTGFVLILTLGLRATNALAGTIDLVLGVIAISLATRMHDPEASPSLDSALRAPRPWAWLAIVIATISGFCALAYETLWTRAILATIGDGTTYAFTAMLGSFLIGHAIGAGLPARARNAPADAGADIRRLGRAQFAAGAFACATVPILVALSAAIHAWRPHERSASGFWTIEAPMYFLVSLAVTALPAAALGASFSLAARLVVGRSRSAALATGALYAANIVGSVAGPPVAAFGLIPTFGTQGTLVLAGIAQASIGVLAVLAGGLRRGKVGASFTFALAAAVVILFEFAANRLVSLNQVYESWEPGRLLYVHEGSGATVTVHEKRTGDRVIDINGANVAGTSGTFRTIQKLQGHLPLLLKPRARDILHVGFGSGGTCKAVSLHKGVRSIDVAEISPEVVATSIRWLEDMHQRVLDDPRVHVKIVDAREEMAVSNKTYDLILSDSILPRFRGNAALYTRDYFALCARRLNPGGMFSTWFALHGLGVDDFRGVIGAMQSVFPHVQIWYPNLEPNENIVIVASLEPITIDWPELQRAMAVPVIAADLADVGLDSPFRLADLYLFGDASARRFAAGGRRREVNTDDKPALEFLAPRSTSRTMSWLANFQAIVALRSPVAEIVSGADPRVISELNTSDLATGEKLKAQVLELEALARSRTARTPLTDKSVLPLLEAARAAYERGLEINPRDPVLRSSADRLRRFLANAKARP